MLTPRMKKLIMGSQMMYAHSGKGGGLILGTTMASKDSGVVGAALSFTRLCRAGSYVAVCGRSNAGIPIFTADGGLTLSQNNEAGISEGIVPTTQVYTFTSTSAPVGTMVGGVIEIIGVGNSVGAGTANATASTNPGTLTPAPANASIGIAFISDSNFTAFPSVTSPNSIVGFIQAGTTGDGLETLVILGQSIPATPGTVFSATGVGSARMLSRKIQ